MSELGSTDANNVNNQLVVQKDSSEACNSHELVEYYSQPEKQPLFLCVVWTILLQTKKSSTKLSLRVNVVGKVLRQISPHVLSSILFPSFIDYILHCLGPTPNPKTVKDSATILNEIVWKHQILRPEDVVL
eukprot:Sdes_comp9040_c0_seq1m468